MTGLVRLFRHDDLLSLMVPYFHIPPIQIGTLKIESFGLLVCLGIVVGYFLAKRRARIVGLDTSVIRELIRLCVVFGLVGAHLVHLFVYHPGEFQTKPWIILRVWEGMSSFGGFAGAYLSSFIYLRKHKINFLPYADAMQYGFWPAWFIARIGCSTVHDHPGRISDFILAMKYPGAPRHDLGFYECLLTLFFLIPLIYFLGRKKSIDSPPPGVTLAIMGLAYSVPRFFLDFLRATDLPLHDVRYFGLTPAQYACILIVIACTRFLLKKFQLTSARRITN